MVDSIDNTEFLSIYLPSDLSWFGEKTPTALPSLRVEIIYTFFPAPNKVINVHGEKHRMCYHDSELWELHGVNHPVCYYDRELWELHGRGERELSRYSKDSKGILLSVRSEISLSYSSTDMDQAQCHKSHFHWN